MESGAPGQKATLPADRSSMEAPHAFFQELAAWGPTVAQPRPSALTEASGTLENTLEWQVYPF